MAKKKTVNKSAAIRDYYKENPKVKPKDVVEALGKQGVEVTAQQVSTVRMNAIKAGLLPKPRKTRKRKPGRPAKAAASAAPRTSKAKGISVEDLVVAKRLVAQMGGVDKARETIAALSKILD